MYSFFQGIVNMVVKRFYLSMKMSRICLLIMLSGILFPGEGYSQSPFRSIETRSSGLSVNMHWMQMTDASFSPLRYNGPGIDIRLLSARTYGNLRRHFHIGAKADYLLNRLDFSAGYVQPGLNWGLAVMVPEISGEDGLSYLGGSISAGTRMYRFLNEDPDHIYWATSYTVDLYYYFDYEIDRDRKVFAELKVPVAGAVSRPSAENHYTYQMPGFAEYVKRIHENIGFATFNKMQSVNLKLTSDLSRTRLKSVSIGYEMDFTRFTEPEPVVYFSNSLFVRILFYAFVW